MSDHQLGIVFALATALCWSTAVIFFRLVGERYSPATLNAFKNVLATACFGILFLFIAPGPLDWFSWPVVKVLLSGLMGVAVGDTLFLYTLNRLGAARTSTIELTLSPMVIVCAFWLLGERLGPREWAGGALILLGSTMLFERRRGDAATMGNAVEWRGVAAGLAAMAVMAVSVVWIKPELETLGLWWSAALRMIGGTLGLLLLIGMHGPSRRDLGNIGWGTKPFWQAVAASFLGTFLAYFFWLAGYRYTQAGVAALLTQTATLIIPVLAYFILKEKITRGMVVAISMGVVGTLIVAS